MIAKRGFDIVASVVGVIGFFPLILLTACAVRMSLGRPVLFAQRRVGLRGREFELRKFRSMLNLTDAAGAPLPDDERVTRVGRYLRRTRLDELPELIQILTGSLSMVGPRPLPRSIVEAQPLGADRSKVRPGLTGLAQVSGNTLLTDPEKFALDKYYVDHRSFGGDLLILARTLGVVLFGERRDEALISKAIRHAHSPNRRR